MNKTMSLRRYTQSIGAKDICILLVNGDYICRNIDADMLDRCRYEAFRYERETDALNLIREKKDELQLVLTNIDRTYANTYGIVEHIENEFKLQIIPLSQDINDIKNASRGGGNSVMVYIMKSLSLNEIINLCANALTREKGKRESASGKLVHAENESSSVASDAHERERKMEINEQNGNIEKKPRFVWTKEMHQKFADAFEQLGHDKAFPKKIVELMNVPGLTRENVASHLQKYREREGMKRDEELFTGSSYDFTDHFGFNTSQGKFQPSHWNPFEKGSRNATTSHFGLNCYGSRLGMPPDRSFLNTIQLKPDHNFRVYGDEKKNVLLSIQDKTAPSNTSFTGFRLAGDGKSVEFGQSNHLGDGGRIRSVNESYIRYPSASSVQQQHSLPEMGNDDPSQFPSFPVSFTPQQKQHSYVAPPGTDLGEPVRFSSKQQHQASIAALLDVDKSMPTILTPQQASIALPGIDWDETAGFSKLQSCVTPLASDWGEPVRLNSKQQQQSSIATLLDVDKSMPTFLTQQQPSLALPETDWDETAGFAQLQSCVVPPRSNWGEPVRLSSMNKSDGFTYHHQQQQQFSIASDLLGVEHNKPVILTQQQPSAALPGSDWNEAASFTQQQSSVTPPWTNWDESLRFPSQQQQSSITSQVVDQNKPAIMTQLQPMAAQPGTEWEEAVSFMQPQSAALLWTDWAEPTNFSPQQPASGNDNNANSEILSNFTSSSLPSEICQLGMADDNGVDASAICVFDDLIFDGQDLT